MKVTLNAQYNSVMDGVSQIVAYTAAKADPTGAAFDTVAIVDEDAEVLARAWDESQTTLLHALRRFVVAYMDVADYFSVTLKVSPAFNTALKGAMEEAMTNFFVYSVASKWFVYTNKQEAGAYANGATAYLNNVHSMALHKQAPKVKA